MPDDLATVKTRYQQVFQMAHFAIEPKIAGKRHEFKFETYQVAVTFPPLPDNDAPPTFVQQQNPFLLVASIFMWNSETRKPLGVEVGSVKLSIEGLQFSIPATAAAHPHVNITLFTDRQRSALDNESNDLYLLAERAMSYWLRVLWWKTGFHMVTRIHAVAHGGFDGGGLINADTGTRFYTPPLGKTIVVPAQPIMTLPEWTQIDSALKAGEEPPMWHEYVTSAHQRMESGDKLAAILDLAVAAESRIRRFLNDKPPKGLNKKTIRNLKMADVFSGWSSYGFPTFPDLAPTKKLFTVRNGIMHSGTHKDADAPFFRLAAGAVTRLLATL